ncbi:phosphoribosylformylglycinamidine synthase [Ranunculus cassubicifolius]
MAATADTTAVTFLRGSCRQNPLLQRNSRNAKSRVFWGSLCGRNSFPRIGNKSFAPRTLLPVKSKALVSENVTTSMDEESSEIRSSGEKIIHYYRVPFMQESATAELLRSVQTKVSSDIVALKTEQCFNVGIDSALSDKKLEVLKWLLGETYEPDNLSMESFLDKEKQDGVIAIVVEVGPRLSFTTAWSANVVSICHCK